MIWYLILFYFFINFATSEYVTIRDLNTNEVFRY